METGVKKQAALLGARIGLIFLITSTFFVFAAYFILSQNFQHLLTDYTMKLVRAMVDQGVSTIEYELRVSKEEAAILAGAFSPPAGHTQEVVFPDALSQINALRAVYVWRNGAAASDGRELDPRSRQDIIDAYNGEISVYGPYFNEEGEYVICYSAPVYQDGQIAGVLSIEKDGYYFCELIQNIRFINSGESYIINSDGTDIAVSNLDHIGWVNDQYNARRLLESQLDPVTRSVMELEAHGLAGESGVGTYEWDGSLCYVVYVPVPSVQWVLLAGLRQEEIDAMTQSVLYSSITKGPVLSVITVIFLSLTGLIIFWIFSSMKKTAEINKKLAKLANYDALTGTMNRNCYHDAIDKLTGERVRSLACVYIDVNGLHEINNYLGHQAGDNMLKAVADALCTVFSHNNVYRIGGDEFVVICYGLKKHDVSGRMEHVRQDLRARGYEVSAGIEWRDEKPDIKDMVNAAEEAMQRDKRLYYQRNGKERQLRVLDQELEQMVLEKQDADAFLSVLAPGFKGVYFVDLVLDTVRHLYIPPYFEEMLKESGNVFSKAMLLYIRRIVLPEYRQEFEKFCDYSYVEERLLDQQSIVFTYQKTDGVRLKLQILNFMTYTQQCRETLWIFSTLES